MGLVVLVIPLQSVPAAAGPIPPLVSKLQKRLLGAVAAVTAGTAAS